MRNVYVRMRSILSDFGDRDYSSKDREGQIDRQEQRHRIKDRYIYTELDREREGEREEKVTGTQTDRL